MPDTRQPSRDLAGKVRGVPPAEWAAAVPSPDVSAGSATEDYLATRAVAAITLETALQAATDVYSAAVKAAVETYAASIVDAGVKLNRRLKAGE